MSKSGNMIMPHPHKYATSVIKRFVSSDSAHGRFFIENVVPRKWRPKLLSAEPIWSINAHKHFSAFIIAELRNFPEFDKLSNLSVSEMCTTGRPLADWIKSLRNVKTWDQAGGFMIESGHWQFRYREKKSEGTLNIWIVRKKGLTATLLASIVEQRES